MHSEIHLRWANWVEPDFPSRWIWQTRGHSREGQHIEGYWRRQRSEAGASGATAGLRFPKGSGYSWEQAQWQQFSPTLRGATPIPVIPQLRPIAAPPFGNSGQRHWSHPWPLFLSVTPRVALIANHFSLLFKTQNPPEYFSPPCHTFHDSGHHHTSPKWLTQPPNQSPASTPTIYSQPSCQVFRFLKSTSCVPHLFQTLKDLTHSK